VKNILRAIVAHTAIALLLFAAVAPGIASAATKQSPAPASSKFSQQRLHRIDEVLDRYVQEQRIAGAVLLVLRDGTPIYQRAAGWSDREAQRPMQMNTIFRIASQTKALTSVVALSLAEEGKLSVGNEVSQYIPTFANTTVAVSEGDKVTIVPAKRPIRLHDLLTHTAGISYGTQPSVARLYEEKQLGPAAGHGWYLADKDEPVCDSMTRLGTLPFITQPGETFIYGYNIDIVGCIAERGSGMPLDELIRKRITEPLHLTDTQFFLPPGQRDRLATVYASTDGKAVRAAEGAKGQGHYIDGPRRDFAGGAGLLSTAQDYARFLEMIRNDGMLDGVRILSPRSVALMHTNLIGSRYAQDGLGFGYGFETVEKYGAKGMESAGSYGWGGAYGSTYFVDPQERLVAVFMIQLMPNDTDIREKITTLIYQALE
jgi:CubicO group peptidase (beta-lactamase class C family)